MNTPTTVLFDSQARAIEKLRRYKVGALFMDPGTGKTRTAYELIKSVDGIDYVLWLTPFQTKDNLRKELEQCGHLEVDLHGVESLSNSDRLFLLLLDRVKNADKPFIVVDESLKIKNGEAKRTKRIIELSRHAEYKLVLNGTPLSRDLLDLYPQMEFLSPKILKMPQAQFKDTFCEYTTITKRRGYQTIRKEFITQYHNVDYLYSLIGPFVFEADLTLDVKEQHIPIHYELDKELKEEYDQLKEKYLDEEKMEFLNNNIFLEMTQKMQRSYACSSEKLTIAKRLAGKFPGKTIIFCKFTNSLDAVKGIAPALTYGKHAFGLNLQQYNRIIFFDKTWDYAQKLQAKRRVYRKGQKDDCYYYDLTGNVGLEAMMNRNINKKTNMLDYFRRKSVKELKELL